MENFAQGYKCKGLLFGGPGNLSNGSAALKTQFGEEVSKGAVIGILVEMSEQALTLTVYQLLACY